VLLTLTLSTRLRLADDSCCAGQIVLRSSDPSIQGKFLSGTEFRRAQSHAFDGVGADHDYTIPSAADRDPENGTAKIATGCSDDDDDGGAAEDEADSTPLRALPVDESVPDVVVSRGPDKVR